MHAICFHLCPPFVYEEKTVPLSVINKNKDDYRNMQIHLETFNFSLSYKYKVVIL